MIRVLASILGLVVAVSLPSTTALAKASSKKVSLSVEASVEGAKVLVDGKEVGKTPLKNRDIAVGNHTIVVRKLGYMEFSEKVQAKAGKPIVLSADLLPFAGVIKVSANVAKATVAVDGKNVGKVPLEYEVKPGAHTVTVSNSGYQTFTQKISADPGNDYEIKATLVKGTAVASGDDLELVPLGGGATSGDGDELALAPLAGGKTVTGGGDDLGLEPLAPLTSLTATSTQGPGFTATTPPGANATYEPAPPWYMEKWVWGVAAGVVAVGVGTTVALLRRGDEAPSVTRVDNACTMDLGGSPCEGPTNVQTLRVK